MSLKDKVIALMLSGVTFILIVLTVHLLVISRSYERVKLVELKEFDDDKFQLAQDILYRSSFTRGEVVFYVIENNNFLS